jgi:hypothetical protein
MSTGFRIAAKRHKKRKKNGNIHNKAAEATKVGTSTLHILYFRSRRDRMTFCEYSGLRFTFASLRLCVRFFFVFSGAFLRLFLLLFVHCNRDSGFAGIEDDELDWLIGGESAMNRANRFTQSFACSNRYMLVRSLFLYR